jgi:hypothetical protein
MSSDEAVFQSDLEDLERLAELFSPISAHARDWYIMLVCLRLDCILNQSAHQELYGKHARHHQPTEEFLWGSNSINESDFMKNEVIIPKNKHGTEQSKENLYIMPLLQLLWAPILVQLSILSPEMKMLIHILGLLATATFQSNLWEIIQRLRMLKSICCLWLRGDCFGKESGWSKC